MPVLRPQPSSSCFILFGSLYTISSLDGLDMSKITSITVTQAGDCAVLILVTAALFYGPLDFERRKRSMFRGFVHNAEQLARLMQFQ